MDILSETPWWVYVLFFGLVSIGFAAARPRVVSLRRLLILPLVFTLWNLAWLNERIHGRHSLLVFWILGLAIGSYFGGMSVRKWIVKADRQQEKVHLPGSWSTLVLILLVFAVRYFFVYHYERFPDTSSDLYTYDAAISGLITGIFMGRAYQVFHKYRRS